MKILRQLGVLAMMGSLLGLAGCAAMHTAISKRKLDVQTKMSASIFLDPVADSQKIVYVRAHNTSGISGMNITSDIKEKLRDAGYKITTNPNRAHYWLQANVLRIGKTDRRTANEVLHGGYGGALSGIAIGATSGALMGESSGAMLAGGLIGGLVGTAADAMVKDQLYTMITDVQVSERVAKGVRVRESSKSVLQQGTSGREVLTSNRTIHWKRYRTRVVSTAEKVNLKFKEAKPILKMELAHAVAGIF